MSAVIKTLTIYRAKKQVSEQLRRHGVKLSSVGSRELIHMSKLWLDIHQDECVADEFRMVHSSPKLRKMYEKEHRQLRSTR